MKEIILRLVNLLVLSAGPLTYLPAQPLPINQLHPDQTYNLVPEHSKDTQYFDLQSRLQNHAPDGTGQGWEVYHLILRCVPSVDPSIGDEYTCLKFTLRMGQSPELSLPALTGWKYRFLLRPDAKDEKGQVLGIDHARFEGLTDDSGHALPPANAYQVYNAFIDFHSMSVFSEASGSRGAQDLKQVGDKIIHNAAYSQAPVDLGTQVAEGSYFKNGEVTLEFKGLGLVNEKTCAIMEYDSGESSFFMVMKPMPGMTVDTRGSSHYWGDIFKDLSTGWIQKATLHEMVVSQTVVPGMDKFNSVVERSILIRNIKGAEAMK